MPLVCWPSSKQQVRWQWKLFAQPARTCGWIDDGVSSYDKLSVLTGSYSCTHTGVPPKNSQRGLNQSSKSDPNGLRDNTASGGKAGKGNKYPSNCQSLAIRYHRFWRRGNIPRNNNGIKKKQINKTVGCNSFYPSGCFCVRCTFWNKYGEKLDQ